MKVWASIVAAFAALAAWLGSSLKARGKAEAVIDYSETRAKEAEDAARRRAEPMPSSQDLRSKAARELARRRDERGDGMRDA